MIWSYLEVGARGWLAGHIIESPSANNSKARGRYSVEGQVDVVIRRHLQPVCIRAIEAPKAKTVRHQPNRRWLYRTSLLPSVQVEPPINYIDETCVPASTQVGSRGQRNPELEDERDT